MKIYYFECDPETGIYKAGCQIDGKRDVYCIWRQGHALYINTGFRQPCYFSIQQAMAFQAFAGSGQHSLEFSHPIA